MADSSSIDVNVVTTATDASGATAVSVVQSNITESSTIASNITSGDVVSANITPAGDTVSATIVAGAAGRDGNGAGDMLKATYDPNSKAADAFSMTNMVEGTTNKILTSTERTKLSGIDVGATANSSDATLLARANHTGTQLASTISNFQTTVSANTDVAGNTTARHSHTNKALLDTYTQTNTALASAVADDHTHSNKTTLDSTTAAYTTAEQTKLAGVATSATANPNAVDGPLSIVDNTIPRYDGTTGKLIQSTGYTIGDDDTLLTAGLINSTTVVAAPTLAANNIGEYTVGSGITFNNNISAPNLSGSNTGDQDLSGKVSTTTTVNGHALSANVTVSADDVLPTQTGNNGKVLGTNGTTSSWVAAATGGGGGDMLAATYDAAGIAQQVVGTTATQSLTNKNLNSGTNTFPTFNQNTTGSAATLTTARTIGTLTGDVTSAGSSFNGSANNTNATVVGKINGVALSGLATGILKNTTTTGVPSIAVAADFPTLNQNTSGSAATLTTPRSIYGNNFDGSAALAQIIASTFGGTGNGFTKFSGPATTEKNFTLPNASDTIGALGTIGTWTAAQTFNSGKLILAGATSGTTTLNSGAIAGSSVLTLPVATDTLMGKATVDTLTNKTFDTAGTGNVLKINGTSVTAVTGTGSNVLSSSPIITTPNIDQFDTASGLGAIWIDWVPTLTGFSANPASAVYRYKLIGKTCWINVRQPNTGTSNAGTFTITLPFTAATITNQLWLSPAQLSDNSVTLSTYGMVTIASAGTTASIFKDAASGSFTASGGKRATFQMCYEVA